MKVADEPTSRKFIGKAHIRNLLEGEWVGMVNDQGEQMEGIRGRAGVAALTLEGRVIGSDLIEMQPDHAFPLHSHAGQHILYVVRGTGVIHMDGVDHPIREGDTIFVPAEYPHGVKTPKGAPGPLVLLAIGYPHRRIDAQDRMYTVLNHSQGD